MSLLAAVAFGDIDERISRRRMTLDRLEGAVKSGSFGYKSAQQSSRQPYF